MDVLKEYASSNKSMRKSWKNAYGMKKVRAIHWDGEDIRKTEPDECFKKCVKMVCIKIFILFLLIYSN